MKCDKCGSEYDPYAELKAAQKAGKVIQYFCQCSSCRMSGQRFNNEPGQWVDEGTSHFAPISAWDGKFHRIKPEPKYREWTPDEVLVGAVVSWVKDQDKRDFQHMIISKSDTQFCICRMAGDIIKYEIKDLKGAFYTLDHGKTWLPCGVLIDE